MSPTHSCRAAFAIAAAALALSAVAAEASKNGTNAERNRELGLRYFEEVWNRGKVDSLDELLAPDDVNHTPNPPSGPGGLKPIVPGMRTLARDRRAVADEVARRRQVAPPAVRSAPASTHSPRSTRGAARYARRKRSAQPEK